MIAVFGMEIVGSNWLLLKTFECQRDIGGYRSQNLWHQRAVLIKHLFHVTALSNVHFVKKYIRN